MLGAKIVDFSCYFLASFFDGFLEASGCIFGAILVDFWRSFFGTFPDFAEKAAPHESSANSSQIEGRAPEKGRKNHPKSE